MLVKPSYYAHKFLKRELRSNLKEVDFNRISMKTERLKGFTAFKGKLLGKLNSCLMRLLPPLNIKQAKNSSETVKCVFRADIVILIVV